MSDDDFDAVHWVDRELVRIPGHKSDHDSRQRRAELRSVRNDLATGRAARQVVNGHLARLCPCNTGPDTDGPQQECPIHGDGETFVMLCRWRDAVVATVTTYREVNDDEESATGAWNRLCALLDTGPWSGAMTDAAIDGPPVDPAGPF